MQLEAEFRRLPPDSNQISSIKKDLTKAYLNEERFWKQKSLISWLKEGDQNTKYFHGCAKFRKAQNRIISIKDDLGMGQQTNRRRHRNHGNKVFHQHFY